MTGCKLCDEYESNLTLASGSNSDMVEEPDPALKTQSVIKSFLPETELHWVLSSSKNAFGYFVKPVSPTFAMRTPLNLQQKGVKIWTEPNSALKSSF